jgi:hypothetical protein
LYGNIRRFLSTMPLDVIHEEEEEEWGGERD